MKMHKGAAALVAAICWMNSACHADGRQETSLDTGWRFSGAANPGQPQATAFDDSAWQSVAVPHSWNRVGGPQGQAYESNIYSGPGWYRLRFKAPKPGAGKRYFLQFDGVGTVADVWLNGRLIGKHQGAFARFRFDVTDAILPGKDNVVAVKADNSLPAPGSTTEHVNPLAGDFFMHGGIYRNVALVATAPVHIDMMDFGGPGVYARATAITDKSAEVEIRTRIANDSAAAQTLQLTAKIFDRAGKLVASKTVPVKTAAHKTGDTTTRLAIANPHLWNGTTDPYLYRVTVSLSQPNGGAIDAVSQPLGLRTIAFDADKGFFLNGKHVALNGVSLHQDKPGKGWAMSCDDQKQDFDIVEEVGANAVRLPHYQHDQCSYDEADKRGLVTWAEIPIVSQVSFAGKPATEALTANAKQQLSELIRQNYNHPAIAMWSIGNEIDLLPTIRKGASKAAPLVRTLGTQAHQEDSSRPSVFADCCEDSTSPDRDVLYGYTDLIGYNRYFGWYYDGFDAMGPFLDRMHAAHPTLPMSVSEYGAGAALSQHSDNPWGGFINSHGRPQPEEYQAIYHEENWKQLKERPYLWGTYVWNLFDFAVKAREEGDTIDINTKGLVTGDRQIRKDAFYFFRSNWNPAPTLHLNGRRYVDRPYAVLDVKAYSNASAAALSLNGKPVGTTSCSAGICLWKDVHLDKGANVLTASATIGGKAVSDTITWQYNGSPDVLRIKTGDLSGITAKGVRFGSDVYFTGGAAKGINPPDTPNDKRISASGDNAALYDTYREGIFAYHIPLPDGRYKLSLHFVEPTAKAAGERLFDVVANGKKVIAKMDVFAAAEGTLKPTARTVTVTVKGGVLHLAFQAVKGEPLVSALEIEPAK